ncbi:hypothetical protein CDAR_589111 [Caerostris darwini]|uniref:Uncharacterized protein n=1 Tax=Caerostris darwini TaxID=1538125 RepID=A0AAV4T9N3_9ARAC|nr:hypothetical protein CDAR_589111 [Caerostris darwini]
MEDNFRGGMARIPTSPVPSTSGFGTHYAHLSHGQFLEFRAYLVHPRDVIPAPLCLLPGVLTPAERLPKQNFVMNASEILASHERLLNIILSLKTDSEFFYRITTVLKKLCSDFVEPEKSAGIVSAKAAYVRGQFLKAAHKCLISVKQSGKIRGEMRVIERRSKSALASNIFLCLDKRPCYPLLSHHLTLITSALFFTQDTFALAAMTILRRDCSIGGNAVIPYICHNGGDFLLLLSCTGVFEKEEATPFRSRAPLVFDKGTVPKRGGWGSSKGCTFASQPLVGPFRNNNAKKAVASKRTVTRSPYAGAADGLRSLPPLSFIAPAIYVRAVTYRCTQANTPINVKCDRSWLSVAVSAVWPDHISIQIRKKVKIVNQGHIFCQLLLGPKSAPLILPPTITMGDEKAKSEGRSSGGGGGGLSDGDSKMSKRF